eukprot:gene41048-61388_t
MCDLTAQPPWTQDQSAADADFFFELAIGLDVGVGGDVFGGTARDTRWRGPLFERSVEEETTRQTEDAHTARSAASQPREGVAAGTCDRAECEPCVCPVDRARVCMAIGADGAAADGISCDPVTHQRAGGAAADGVPGDPVTHQRAGGTAADGVSGDPVTHQRAGGAAADGVSGDPVTHQCAGGA